MSSGYVLASEGDIVYYSKENTKGEIPYKNYYAKGEGWYVFDDSIWNGTHGERAVKATKVSVKDECLTIKGMFDTIKIIIIINN